MPDITPAQRAELVLLTQRLRAIAVRHGPLQSFWDIIGDMEAFVVGERTLLHKGAEEWIALATEVLRAYDQRRQS
jgi:hypothetical protein